MPNKRKQEVENARNSLVVGFFLVTGIILALAYSSKSFVEPLMRFFHGEAVN